MEIRIKQYWYNIKNSLWFLPSIMALASAVLAFTLLEVDGHIVYDDFPLKWFIYGGQRDGARSVLSTIAASMVTIAAVTFSITLVALTMASAQFGPRLLRNFIADTGNQFVIGTFISTFIYSLIILLSIRGSENDEFIPKVSIVFGFLLAIFSLGVIIYFIHHVTTSIQADYVIKASYNDFLKISSEYLLDAGDQHDHFDNAGESEEVKQKFHSACNVSFTSSGYIQSVDYAGSCKWAEKNDLVIEWLVYPGLFASIHQVFAVIHHKSGLAEDAEKQLKNFFVVDYQRTPNQDLLFSLKQISEVGVRALSPGTNDPYTAITCIQWLGAALSELSRKKIDSPVERDDHGTVRVIKTQITYQSVVDACFDHLIVYATSNIYVTAEILASIRKAVISSTNDPLMQVLKTKSTLIYASLQGAGSLSPRIESDYREIMQARVP
jgi:uncharacterized membrane protein